MDIYELDVGRVCNLAYAQIVSEIGGDPGEARRKIDAALVARAKPRGTPKAAIRATGRSMSLAQAQAIATEVERHDAQFGRRVSG